MKANLEPTGKARFDTRMPAEQKQLFEKAAALGGFSSLSDFMLQAAQESAMEIIKEHNLIIASERDKEIFFDALMNPKEPNEALKAAADRLKQAKENGI